MGAPSGPKVAGSVKGGVTPTLSFGFRLSPLTTRRAWAPRRGQEAEGKELGGCGSWTEPVLCARPGFVIFTSRLREAVTCAWSQPALGSVCPGLSAGSTTGKLRDHGQVVSPLCALLSSSVKGSSDPEVIGCSEVIHINSLAQVSGGTN